MLTSYKKRKKAPHDPRLVCSIKNLEYDFINRIGKIYFPVGHCCDMSGCIGLFSGIDHTVSEIQTFSGDKKDTYYYKLRATGQWFSRRGE